MQLEKQLIVARSLVLTLLVLLDVGILPIGQSKVEAGVFEKCTAKTPCLATFGWCIGITGSVGMCGGLGWGCIGGSPMCRGTINPLAPAPLVPLAVCNGATGC